MREKERYATHEKEKIGRDARPVIGKWPLIWPDEEKRAPRLAKESADARPAK